jgi:hypothetical protein
MPMLIMDYHKLGGLDKVTKAAAGGIRIHDRTLWLICGCRMPSLPCATQAPTPTDTTHHDTVFRGLVALRSPPKKWHPAPAPGAAPAVERIPKLSRSIEVPESTGDAPAPPSPSPTSTPKSGCISTWTLLTSSSGTTAQRLGQAATHPTRHGQRFWSCPRC